MSAKKIFALVLILLGAISVVSGISQYNKVRTPNTCIVSFAKSQGGKASFELDQSIRRARCYGITVASGGIVFVVLGGVILFKSGRKGD